jgi:CheY-like chemotaxis protein
MHILLVEDDSVNQKIATQFLSRWGMEVTIANDGTEAVELLNQKIFNLVLMDLNMPVMDGFEATRSIRASDDPYFKTIPILAYTASSVADTKEKAEKLGMNDFIKKPLSPEEMHYKINHYAISSAVDARPLRIKFDLYADSDDGFKIELLQLMMNNIRELQQAVYKAFYSAEIRTYQSISHKVKSTLILLDDREFMYMVDDLKHGFTNAEKQSILQEKVSKFNFHSAGIMKTLEQELNQLKVVE